MKTQLKTAVLSIESRDKPFGQRECADRRLATTGDATASRALQRIYIGVLYGDTSIYHGDFNYLYL